MENVRWGPLAASALTFVLAYAGIILSRAHRTILAFCGAVLMIGLGSWLSFYDTTAAVRAIDFDTIMLIVGMMILVSLFRQTGYFQYLAIRAAKAAKGRPWILLIYLGAVTAFVSMILDNVTTLLIIVPVTISLLDILEIPVFPFLVSTILLSNIGGVATLIGDPPNMLISSASGFGFVDFLIHVAPVVVVAWVVAQGLLLLLFRRELSHVPSNVERLMGMDERRAIVDPRATNRMLVTLGVMLLLFFIHQRIGIEPGLVALVGACISVLWLRPDFDQVLHDIQWDVIVFFIALFILAGGLASSGIVTLLGNGISAIAGQGGVVVLAIVILWAGALASGVIGSVPVTIAVIPLIKSLASHGIDAAPLWWALAIGVGFGANLTPLGAASSVVLADLFESLDSRVTFRRWGHRGTWVALTTCALGTLAVLLATQKGWFG